MCHAMDTLNASGSALVRTTYFNGCRVRSLLCRAETTHSLDRKLQPDPTSNVHYCSTIKRFWQATKGATVSLQTQCDICVTNCAHEHKKFGNHCGLWFVSTGMHFQLMCSAQLPVNDDIPTGMRVQAAVHSELLRWPHDIGNTLNFICPNAVCQK